MSACHHATMSRSVVVVLDRPSETPDYSRLPETSTAIGTV
jgi:hypothetical protein